MRCVQPGRCAHTRLASCFGPPQCTVYCYVLCWVVTLPKPLQRFFFCCFRSGERYFIPGTRVSIGHTLGPAAALSLTVVYSPLKVTDAAYCQTKQTEGLGQELGEVRGGNQLLRWARLQVGGENFLRASTVWKLGLFR